MLNVANKIIKEDDAIATIKFKDGISEEKANLIDSIISKNYDQECDFIIKLDRNHYKGDMACLSILAWDNVEELKNKGYNSLIEKYVLYNKRTNETEDFIGELL